GEVNERQQAINQGLTLSRVNEALIRDIAVASIRNKDSKLGALLSAQGISVNLTPAATPDAGAAIAGGTPAAAATGTSAAAGVQGRPDTVEHAAPRRAQGQR
ncbi:MAG: hypothetical protein ACREX6_05860, partial [Casimicrobiaceae bacterium]